MKRYIGLSVLILSLVFFLLFLSAQTCAERILRGSEGPDEQEKKQSEVVSEESAQKALEELLIEAAPEEKSVTKEEASKEIAEEVKNNQQEQEESESKLVPTGIIFYTLLIVDMPIERGDMTIDFDKREVEGTFGYIAEGKGWDGADINCSATFEGKADLETKKILADGAVEFKGMGPDYTGGWIEWDGAIASDYKSAQGVLKFWDGCMWNWNGYWAGQIDLIS